MCLNLTETNLHLSFSSINPSLSVVLVRLQAAVGPRGVRGRRHASRALGSHLEAGHRPLQQVSPRNLSQACYLVRVGLAMRQK